MSERASDVDPVVAYERDMWGWFGEPWPSGICFLDDAMTQVDWAHHKDTPVGERCLWCREVITVDDQGSAMPHYGDQVVIRHQHKECILRQVLGSYSHLTSNCPGDGSCHHREDDLGMSLREDALAVWAWSARNRFR